MARTPANPNPPAATPAPQPPAKAGNNLPAKPTPSPTATLRQLLERQKGDIAKALPKHMSADNMLRVALTAVQRVPKLLQADPMTVVGCVQQAAELGLELSGVLGHCYLVPFWNSKTRKVEAQFMVGYKGLLTLAHRSGQVRTIAAHEVYSGDEFYYEYGSHPKMIHRPALTGRGEVIAYYATLNTKDGGMDFEVMSREDVIRHRDQFSKSADSGPWVTCFDEMAKKTVIRKLLKRCPMSVSIQKATSLDEQGEAGVGQDLPQVDVGTAERANYLRERIQHFTQPSTEDAPAIEHQPPAEPDPVPEGDTGDPRAEEPPETKDQLIARLNEMLLAAGWPAERVADHMEQAFELANTTDLSRLTDDQLRTWIGYMELTRGK